MNALPNPFQSALEPSRVADTATGPGSDPSDPVAVTFSSSAAGRTSPAVDPAVVSSQPLSGADAAATESSTARGGHQESPAEATQNPATAGLLDLGYYVSPPELTDISDVSEIFHFARKLMADDDRRFVLDVERFMADIEPPPMFLRNPSPEYLRANDLMPVLAVLARH